MSDTTIVHLMRHGEVHNPGGTLYGRRSGYHLSELGQKMAQKVADTIKDRDIVHLRVSPLTRDAWRSSPTSG
jgi:broad specificity phosphatase PhoE